LSLGHALGLGAGAVPVAAIGGELATTALLFGAAGVRGRLAATTLLLTGVVFNAFASAAIVFLASLGGMAEGTSIFLWLIGNLASARSELLLPLAGLFALGLAGALPLARTLNLLALGDEAAEQLGIRVETAKRVLLFATALMVSAAVSVSG
jgi:iron complex transport system permease protein